MGCDAEEGVSSRRRWRYGASAFRPELSFRSMGMIVIIHIMGIKLGIGAGMLGRQQER